MAQSYLTVEEATVIFETICETICRIEDAGKGVPVDLANQKSRLEKAADILNIRVNGH